MTKLCENTGNWLNMCESLVDVTSNGFGGISAQVMSSRKLESRRLSIVAGRAKGNKVELNYCPFCGVNIVTEYQDQGVNDESDQGNKHANQ